MKKDSMKINSVLFLICLAGSYDSYGSKKVASTLAPHQYSFNGKVQKGLFIHTP